MTNLNIAKLYLATTPTVTTAAQLETAVTSGAAATAVNALTGTALLNAIYNALFGRDADADGLAYWGASTLTGDALITAINGGAATYPADGAFAALNTADKATLANKAAVTTTGVSEAQAVFILDTVTDSAATVTAAAAAAAEAAAANTTKGTGGFYTLTAGADIFTENNVTAANKTTALDDEFRGQLDTLDVVKAGAGLDTVTAIHTANNTETIKPYMSSVENVNMTLQTTAAAKVVTLDLGDSTGVNNVSVTLQDTTAVNVKNVTTSNKISIVDGGTTNTTDFTVTYKDLSADADGGSDAATISLKDIDVDTATVAGIEVLTLNLSGKAGDIDTLTAAALEKLVITGGVDDASIKTEKFDLGSVTAAVAFAGLDTVGGVTETAVIDASASTNAITIATNDDNSLTVTGGAGKLTLDNTANNTTDNSSISVSVTAGAGALALTLQGGGNAANDKTTNSVTVIGSTGDDVVDITAVVTSTDLTATALINESQLTNATVNTGAGNDSISINAGAVKLDAGEGDDTLTVADGTLSGSNIDKWDTIDMGAGKDTVVTADATLDATDKTVMGFIKNVEVVQTTAVAEKVVDMTGLTTVTELVVSAHTATAAVTTTDGKDALTFTSSNTNSNIVLKTSLTGQAGDGSGKTSGNGLTLLSTLDNGSNIATITTYDNVDIAGGTGTNSAANGTGISAATVDVLNIKLYGEDTTKDTVTIGNITLANNATINITDSLAAVDLATKLVTLTFTDHANSIDLGAITGDNINIVADTMDGSVAIAATAGNATVTTGAGADNISTGTGVDVISTGAGDDIIDSQTGADSITTGTGNDTIVLNASDSVEAAMKKVTDFKLMEVAYTASTATDTAAEVASTNVAGANADILDITDITVVANQATAMDTGVDTTGTDIKGILSNGMLTLSGADAATVDTLAEWIDQAEGVIGNSEAVGFEFDGNTYLVTSAAAGATDCVIELTGLVGVVGIAQVDSSSTAIIGGTNYMLLA